MTAVGGYPAMEFDGARSIEADRGTLWDIVSEPDALVRCVPGADAVTRESEGTYTGDIERSFAGLTVELDGEVIMADLDPPDRMVVDAAGVDRLTKTEMDAQGHLALQRAGPEMTVLDYHVEMEFTGKLPAHLLKSRIDSDIDRFFDNVRVAAEEGFSAVGEQEAEQDDGTDDDDGGGLLSRF
jgi:carbon monoxide dehydrogenase subunit G